MWDERSFDTRSFDERSWLFLIQTPYVDLSHHERIYVRSLLSSLYAREKVEQIVSFAATNKLSVCDSVSTLFVTDTPVIEALAERIGPQVLEHERPPCFVRTRDKDVIVRDGRAPQLFISPAQSGHSQGA